MDREISATEYVQIVREEAEREVERELAKEEKRRA
jgi:hypothetical protein